MDKSCLVLLPMAEDIPDYKGIIVGADRGALLLADHGVRADLSIGDFDSVSQEEYKRIVSNSQEIIKLNPIKDDSDSEAAVTELRKRGFHLITLYGALGGRFDHSVVNLRIAEKFPGEIVILDARNRIWSVGEGIYTIKKENFKYLSIFAVRESIISLCGMKYPLDSRTIYPLDLYGLSNEIEEEAGEIRVQKGQILIIQSKD